MILVTSALGNQGRLLLPKLAERELKVRALDIAPGAERALAALGAAESLCADLMDGAALAEAMQGVHAVYHIGPNAHPAEDAIGLAMIAAAQTARVEHFTYSSVLHPHIPDLVQHMRKLRVETALIESGLPFTILRPAHYMQTLQHRAAYAGGSFRLTWNLDRRQALVDLDDVTTIAARILAEGAAHAGATYELSSADCLTAHEIAATIGRAIGTRIRAERVTPREVLASVFRDAPDPEVFAERVRLFEAVAGWYDRHDFVGCAGVAEHLLGAKPTSFAQFLARDLAVWRTDEG